MIFSQAFSCTCWLCSVGFILGDRTHPRLDGFAKQGAFQERPSSLSPQYPVLYLCRNNTQFCLLIHNSCVWCTRSSHDHNGLCFLFLRWVWAKLIFWCWQLVLAWHNLNSTSFRTWKENTSPEMKFWGMEITATSSIQDPFIFCFFRNIKNICSGEISLEQSTR